MGNILLAADKKELSKEEKQRQLPLQYGVLMPPLFVVCKDDGYATSKQDMPISSLSRLHAYESPNMIDNLWKLTAGYNLLHEYMSTGIYFAAPTNPYGELYLALNTRDDSLVGILGSSNPTITIGGRHTPTTSENMSTSSSPQPLPMALPRSNFSNVPPSTSFLSLTQTSTPLNFQLLIPASPPLSPHLQVSASSSLGAIKARIHPLQPQCNGHVQASLHMPPLGDVRTLLGAYMTSESIYHFVDDLQDSSNKAWNIDGPMSEYTSTRNYSPFTVHIQGVAEFKDTLLAVHAELPLAANSGGNFTPEQTDTMLWIDLSGRGSTNEEKNDDKASVQTLPPLWLSVKRSQTRGKNGEGKWTLNLSQILTIDRTCWNILEERAPQIRNPIGWTVQIEQNDNDNEQKSKQSNTSWSFGASWQINRNVALKAILDDNGTLLKTNLLFKRWQQPRMTLSILNAMDLSRQHQYGIASSFLGFGLEIETTALEEEYRAKTTTHR